MASMSSIGFKYKESNFAAVVRLKETRGKKEYYVTIMNGELERALYGSHIFVEIGGRLQVADRQYCKEVLLLRRIIAESLADFLKSDASFDRIT